MVLTRSATVVFFVGLFTTLVPAQRSIVVPPSHAGVAGTGSTNVPFGRSTPMRLQAVYDPLNFAGPIVVTGVGFRLDEGQTTPGKRVELECRLSSMGAGIVRIQSEFAQNRGPDEQVVIARRTIDLPALGQAMNPNPFHLQLSLDRPFPYDPAGGALVLEIAVFGQEARGLPLDSTWVCDSPTVRYGPPGCGPASGPALSADCLTTGPTWGRNLALRVFDARPFAVTGLFLGTIEQGVWNGLPIPSDLGLFGAPGCSLSVDPRIVASRAADATGSAVYDFFVPSIPDLKGTVVRFQGVAVDPTANALGVVTSQAAKVEICGWEPVARVFAAGLTASIGQRELGVAPVLQLTVQ